MYDSFITTKSLIDTVRAETDISTVIPNQSWLNWINEVEQMLYTEVVKELRVAVLSVPSSPIDMEDVVPDTGQAQPIFEDVIKFYGDGKEFQKASVISSITLHRSKSIWYKDGASIGFSTALNSSANLVKIVYCVRPELKAMTTPTAPAVPDFPTDDIALPPEFIELMSCRLRGEAYKIANEDGQAGKWIADYNAYVESFKTWVTAHNSGYGE